MFTTRRICVTLTVLGLLAAATLWSDLALGQQRVRGGLVQIEGGPTAEEQTMDGLSIPKDREATAIIEASDSGHAVRQLEQHPDVELILLDLALPDRDGFDLLLELGQRYATTSVVVLSASRTDTEKRWLASCGSTTRRE